MNTMEMVSLLFITNVIILAICFFSLWAMDSLKFRPVREWTPILRDIDWYLKRSWFANHGRMLGFIPTPSPFKDGWHFFKMILVGMIILLVTLPLIFYKISSFIIIFITISVVYNILWLIFYSLRYNVFKKGQDEIN